MGTQWPVVRVIGPSVLARGMEALLGERGVPLSHTSARVLLLLPPGGVIYEGSFYESLKIVSKPCSAVRMVGDLTTPEERRFFCPPGITIRGLVSLEDPITSVLDALCAASHNEAYCSPRLLPGLLHFLHHSQSLGMTGVGLDPTHPTGGSISEKNLAHSELSQREREVARAAAQGMSNEEIAQSLHISVATVKFHLSHVFQKLNVSRRSQIGAALPDPKNA